AAVRGGGRWRGILWWGSPFTAQRRDAEVARVAPLRDRLAAGLVARVPGCFVNGDPNHKIAGNCHVGFTDVEAETLLVALDRDGMCAAAGSSCTSGATEPSHVLAAMGLAPPPPPAPIPFLPPPPPP